MVKKRTARLKILFFSPKGIEQDRICDNLADFYNIPYIAGTRLIRGWKESGSFVARRVVDQMNSGDQINHRTYLSLIFETIKANSSGFLLDGIPRNSSNLEERWSLLFKQPNVIYK